jgi:hypothetical protein
MSIQPWKLSSVGNMQHAALSEKHSLRRTVTLYNRPRTASPVDGN